MWLKHKIWILLSIVLVVWFEYSGYSECYYNADDSQIHVINGEEWVMLDAEVEKDYSITEYQEIHLRRRSLTTSIQIEWVNQAIAEIPFLSFILPNATTRSEFVHNSRTLQTILYEWLHLKYLF